MVGLVGTFGFERCSRAIFGGFDDEHCAEEKTVSIRS